MTSRVEFGPQQTCAKQSAHIEMKLKQNSFETVLKQFSSGAVTAAGRFVSKLFSFSFISTVCGQLNAHYTAV